MTFKQKILPITTFARIDIRRLFRDKVAIFFTFVFPLIFLFVFGGIFGGKGGVNFNIALFNESNSQIANEVVESIKQGDIVKINEQITSFDDASEKMTRGELDAIIMLPSGFGEKTDGQSTVSGELKVVYNQNNEQGAQTLAAILGSYFKELNSQFVDTTEPFTVSTESTATESQTRFDYVFSGLLGFSVLSLGIFGPTNVFPKLKQRGVLRRYHTTPLKVWQYFVGNVISNAFVGIMSVATMFLVAVVVFDLNMRGDYLSLALMVVLGVTVLFGIGLAVGGWAKNETQAAPLANIVTFPMMFLSGTFFPRYAMPEWLQSVSDFLPLTPVIDGVRLIITEGKTIIDIAPQIGLLAAWAVVIYLIAFRVFRWE